MRESERERERERERVRERQREREREREREFNSVGSTPQWLALQRYFLFSMLFYYQEQDHLLNCLLVRKGRCGWILIGYDRQYLGLISKTQAFLKSTWVK
jgi:hypothetical protein